MNIGIRQLANEVGREVCTLRRWEREGKIPPAHRAGLKRKRYWTPQEAADIKAKFGPDPLESLLATLERLAPVIMEQAEALLGDKALAEAAKALLGEQDIGKTVRSLVRS